MNSAIASVLNRVLGDYLENLNPEQLNLSIFSGEIKLQNLKLKSEILKTLGLPFDMLYGQIGNLSVRIPWTSISSSPLKIEISEIYLLLGPKLPGEWNEAEEKQNRVLAKASSINNFEALNSNEVAVNAEPGFVEKLVTKIIDNIQISINSVYIRYEDNISSIEPFAVGISFKGIQAATCNSNWETEFISDSAITHKLVLLEEISVFLDYGDKYLVKCEDFKELAQNDVHDHRYFVKPTSYRLEAVMNKDSKDLSIPQVTGKLENSEIEIGIETNQVTHILKVLEFMGIYSNFQSGVSNSDVDIEFSAEEAAIYRDIYKKWKIIEKSTEKDKVSSLKAKLELHENGKTLSTIIKQRQNVTKELELLRKEESIRSEIVQIESVNQGYLSSFTGYFWGKKENPQEDEDKKEKLKTVNEKLLQILREKDKFASEVHSFISDTQIFENLPDNYVRFKLIVSVPSTIISIKDAAKDLLIYQVRNFNVEAGIRPDTIYAKLEIGKACLEDKVLNSSDCPNIIIGEYLKIDYDQLPAPKLEMKSGAINIVVNLESLLTVSNEFSSAVSKQIDLSKYYDIASSKTSEYIKMGEKYVKSIAKTGSQASIELKIDMKAPVIFIPYDIQNLSEGMLVLDGGQFCADTEVVEITGFEFDKYKFSLSRTEISVIWDCENINSWKSCKKHDFLSPVDYNFTLLNCKEKQNLVPGFQLATSIGRLSFELDEQLIYFTLTLKDRLLATLNKASTLEAPEAKKRGDSLVVETEALKDKMKRINDIIALKTSVEFEEISLRLRQAQGQLASMKFSGLRMDIALGSLGEVIGNLKLNSIEMIDLRHNVQLRNVIYNPILNTVDEDEFNDALEEEIVQFLLSFELRPKQDFLNLNLKFSEMRIMPSPDLLSDVMKFFTRPISRASVLIKSTSSDSDVEIPIISSKYRTIFNTKASIQLSNFEIWLPTDVFNKKKRIACFRFGVSLFFNSSQEYTSSFDTWMREINREYHSVDDEASLEITHIGGLVGLVHNDRILHSEERTSDILRPSRISISYNCSVSQTTETKIRINLESMCIDIGFRDLQFLKTLSGLWSDFNPSDMAAGKVENISAAKIKTDIVAECDALQINLLEDTGIKAYSLLHFHFSNFTSKAVINQSDLEAALSTFFFADCYNIQLAAWEPLIEDWNFDFTAKQAAGGLMIVNFEAPRIFNINLTLSNLEIVGTLMSKLGQDSTFWTEEVISSYIPDKNEALAHGNFLYVLHNELDEHIEVWLDIKNAEIWDLPPHGNFTFGQQIIDKLNASIKADGNKHGIMEEIQAPTALVIKVADYEPTKGIFIESIGVRGFSIKKGTLKVNCVLDISAESNEKNIKIQTSKVCVNSTKAVINLNFQSKTVAIYPNSVFSLPLSWCETPISPLLVGHEGNADLFQEGSIQLDEKTWIITELGIYKTLSGINQTIIQFKAPFTYRNLLPCPVSVFYNNLESPLFDLSPGESQSVLTIDPSTDEMIYRFQLQIENEYMLETDWKSLRNSNKFDLVLTGNFSGNKLTAEISKYVLRNNVFIDLTNRKRAKKELVDKTRAESRLIEVYCGYLVVNKSDWALECNKNAMKINAHSVALLSSKKNIKIRTSGAQYGDPSSWSDNFNISAVGIAGCIELNNTEAHKKVNEIPAQLYLGIYTFDAPPPLIKSKVVYIMPRFMIRNNLGFPIYTRQVFKNQEFGKRILEIQDGQELQYQLENAKQSKTIQISRDCTDWSASFSVQDIEDFQVKFAGLEEEKQQNRDEWYRPSALNSFMHFARIIISTEDEACIHISIITPVDPEFRIVNSSQHEIMVNQLKRSEVVVPPMTTIPWAFDDLQEAKKVEMQFKQDKKVYEIEKIGKCKKLGNNSVSVNVKGVTRELRIIPVGASFQKIKLEKVKEKQGYQFIASLAGVGLSIIDRTPSEVFYLSFQYLTVKFTTKSQKVKNEIRNQMKIDLKLRTIQLDNMQAGNRLFPILFTPLANKDNEDTPFFQVRIHKINTSKESSSEISSIDKYSWFEVSVQEMQIQVNQEVTTILLNMMTALDKIYGNKLDHKKFANVTSLKEVCLYLDASSPILSYNPSQASKKIFFEFFHLCAVKIYVSFKAGKRDIDFQLDPMQGFGLFRALFSIGSAFTNISESPLRFRELIIKESFQTMSNLSWLVMSNYIRQGLFQIYKIFGSVDLLGNPIGLIDKLGTGVFEFLNEPAKGALKGPKSFALGVEKGIRSLIGNVIAGGFGSVSKMTGGLYELVKEVSGDRQGGELINDKDNVAMNLYSGVKGGVFEISDGITGIFTKPWKGAKKSGAAGFFKGVGSGLLGAATAPLLAALRLGSGLAAGITSAGTLLARGKVDPKGRLRFPRHFNARQVLVPYNPEIAEAQELLHNLKQFKRERIIFYLHITEDEDLIILLTLNRFILLIDAELVNMIPIKEIKTLEIHKSGSKFVFYAGNVQEQIVIQSYTFSSLARLYAAVTCIPLYKKSQPSLRKIRIPTRYGSSCCRF